MPGRLLGFDISGKPNAAPPAYKRHSLAVGALSSSPPKASMDHFKRPSLGRNKQSSESKEKKPSAQRVPSGSSKAPKQVQFELVTESPPALLLDEPQRSSGALYAVKLVMTVATPVVLQNLTLKLEAISQAKEPVVQKCQECTRQSTVVKDWSFISGKTSFPAGTHEFPASHLLPGHLPATTFGNTSTLEYQFAARAQSETGAVFDLTKPLHVSRAIRPREDKTSMRIFPPTNITLHVTLPPVIHPLGEFNVTAKMTGLTTKKDDTHTRWRLKKLDWRIEEHEQSISPACAKHTSKVGGENKGVMHEHTRLIGDKEIKSGWKSDPEAGDAEMEITCNIDRSRRPNNDVESQNGLKITHTLVLEMIIAEEWAPASKPNSVTPTGMARVLRTQFGLIVTERAGMGIAWDDETPPTYEDVPASPPAYTNTSIEHYDGEELNEDVEHLRLGP